MTHPLWKSWFRLKPEAPSLIPRRRRTAVVVPLLEALEDRCLPSVTPMVTFSPDTLYQALTLDSVTTAYDANSANPAAPLNTLNVSFNYVGQTGIQFAQVTFTGNLSISIVDLSPVSGTGSPPVLTPAYLFQAIGQINSQSANPVSQSYSLSVSLFPTQGTPHDRAANYALTITALQSASGAALGITVAAFDVSGQPSANYAGIFQASNPDGPSPSMNSPALGSPGPTSLASGVFFPNTSSGISAFLIVFPGTNFQGLQKEAIDVAAEIPFLRVTGVAALMPDLTALDFGVGSSSGQLDGNPDPLGEPETGPAGFRRPFAYANTLVLADTGPGYSLTLSIVQEVNQRASSSAAQVTWTGLRPPIEAPWLGPPLEKADLKLSSFQDHAKTALEADTDNQRRASPEVEVRPTEKMVAEILQSLQQARADDRAKDVAQGANRPPAELHVGSEQTESWALASWPWDRGDEPADPNLLGDIVLPLNQFLDSVEAKAPYSRSDAAEQPGPEQNEPGENRPSPNSRRITFHRGWIHLAEGVAGLLWVLGGPGAIWPGLTQITKKAEGDQPGSGINEPPKFAP